MGFVQKTEQELLPNGGGRSVFGGTILTVFVVMNALPVVTILNDGGLDENLVADPILNDGGIDENSVGDPILTDGGLDTDNN